MLNSQKYIHEINKKYSSPTTCKHKCTNNWHSMNVSTFSYPNIDIIPNVLIENESLEIFEDFMRGSFNGDKKG